MKLSKKHIFFIGALVILGFLVNFSLSLKEGLFKKQKKIYAKIKESTDIKEIESLCQKSVDLFSWTDNLSGPCLFFMDNQGVRNHFVIWVEELFKQELIETGQQWSDYIYRSPTFETEDKAKILFWQLNSLIRFGELDEARELFKRWKHINNENQLKPESHFNLLEVIARLDSKSDRSKLSAKSYEFLLDRYPNLSAKAHIKLRLSSIYEESGEYKKALALLEKSQADLSQAVYRARKEDLEKRDKNRPGANGLRKR